MAHSSESEMPHRRPELDAIRLTIVLGLIFFHGALVFDARDDFYVKNEQTIEATTLVAGVAVIWAMPMLFLIAGLGSWHSLQRRRPGEFMMARLWRLGLPLLLATLAIVPIPQWLRLRSDPGYQESYWQFLPQFFDVGFDPADFPFVVRGEHFETGHLWFVVLLLTFSLMLGAMAKCLPHGLARALLNRCASFVQRRRGTVLLPAVPLAAISAVLGMEEGLAGWNRWAYLLFFLCGFGLAADRRFRAAMRDDAVWAAVAGVVIFAAAAPAFMSMPTRSPATPHQPWLPGSRSARRDGAGWSGSSVCWIGAGVQRTRRPTTGPAAVSARSTASSSRLPSPSTSCTSRSSSWSPFTSSHGIGRYQSSTR